MAVIYRSDIKNVDAYAKKVLSNEVTETQTVIDSINSFIGDSPSKLEGKAWNKERSRFEVYIKALEKRKDVSTLLAEAIKSANRIMENYIAAFPWTAFNKIPNVSIPKDPNLDMIDSGWIAELQKALNDAKTAYANAEIAKNSISTKDKKEEELRKAKVDIAGYQNKMDSANKIIEACTEVINYLNQMKERDAEAYAKYSAIEAAISELKALIQDVDDLFAPPVKSSPKYVYVPIGGAIPSTPINDGSSSSNTTDNESKETPSIEPANVTPGAPTGQVTPLGNTISNNPIPSKYNGTGTDNNEEYIDDEMLDDDYLDENEGLVIGDDTIPEDSNKPIDNGNSGVVREKDNTLRNVGLGIAGAAAVGAAGYGAYKAIKNSKENNEIEEEDEEYNDDYSDDFEIKTNDDDEI